MDRGNSENRGSDLEPVTWNAKRASSLLKAMGNRHRLLVLCHLIGGETSAGKLGKVVNLSQSALSQHLARLRRANLVKTRRQAQTIFYSLEGEEAACIIGALNGLYCGGGGALFGHLERRPRRATQSPITLGTYHP